jgi:hypothetical protein
MSFELWEYTGIVIVAVCILLVIAAKSLDSSSDSRGGRP